MVVGASCVINLRNYSALHWIIYLPVIVLLLLPAPAIPADETVRKQTIRKIVFFLPTRIIFRSLQTSFWLTPQLKSEPQTNITIRSSKSPDYSNRCQLLLWGNFLIVSTASEDTMKSSQLVRGLTDVTWCWLTLAPIWLSQLSLFRGWRKKNASKWNLDSSLKWLFVLSQSAKTLHLQWL